MAWTDLTFPFGSLLTSTKMTQLDDNFDAFAAKDSGAPVLANSYIVRAMLNTTTQSINNNITGGSSANFSFTSSSGYGFDIYSSSMPANPTAYLLIAGSGFPSVRITAGTTGNHVIAQRYIVSSPPWDLGDGDIQNFVYLLVDSLGNIVSSVSCVDPPWNFLTQKLAIKKASSREFSVDDVDKDPSKQEQFEQELDRIQVVAPVRLTLQEKVSPAPNFPHPWFNDPRDLTGLTITMLDPVSPFMERLKKLDELGLEDGEGVLQLLNAGYLQFDNTPLSRAAPPGVTVVAPRWRWTARS